jgi:hypothetical protein
VVRPAQRRQLNVEMACKAPSSEAAGNPRKGAGRELRRLRPGAERPRFGAWAKEGLLACLRAARVGPGLDLPRPSARCPRNEAPPPAESGPHKEHGSGILTFCARRHALPSRCCFAPAPVSVPDSVLADRMAFAPGNWGPGSLQERPSLPLRVEQNARGRKSYDVKRPPKREGDDKTNTFEMLQRLAHPSGVFSRRICSLARERRPLTETPTRGWVSVEMVGLPSRRTQAASQRTGLLMDLKVWMGSSSPGNKMKTPNRWPLASHCRS